MEQHRKPAVLIALSAGRADNTPSISLPEVAGLWKGVVKGSQTHQPVLLLLLLLVTCMLLLRAAAARLNLQGAAAYLHTTVPSLDDLTHP